MPLAQREDRAMLRSNQEQPERPLGFYRRAGQEWAKPLLFWFLTDYPLENQSDKPFFFSGRLIWSFIYLNFWLIYCDCLMIN